MKAFVDTSAIFALMVCTDRSHDQARAAFGDLRRRQAVLFTTSYVLVESYALLAARVGLGAAQEFRDRLGPLLSVTWVDHELHERGLDLAFEQKRRRLSLVDCVSFVVMRQQRISSAFAYDEHFVDAGFSLVS